MSCLTMQPRFYTRPVSSFMRPSFPFAEVESLFSLLDGASPHGRTSRPSRTFQPRFDVRETDDAFHLSGELPGMSQQDVNIEFADNNTLTVHGRTVRESQKGDRSLVEGNTESKAIAEADAKPSATESQNGYHKATVEDDGEEASTATSTAAPATPATTVADTTEKQEVTKAEPKHEAKYWVSERSVGEFHRSFTFPGHVDHNAVRASLKDGILNVEVPKVKPQEPRQIQIE